MDLYPENSKACRNLCRNRPLIHEPSSCRTLQGFRICRHSCIFGPECRIYAASLRKIVLSSVYSAETALVPYPSIHYRIPVDIRILLKALIPGFLPLLIYVAVESVFGQSAGLLAGLALGAVQFFYILITQKKVDPFVLVDSLLLALAGGVSLLLGNGLFFKLQPVVVELVMAAVFGISLTLPPEYLFKYMESQLRGIKLDRAVLPAMRKSLVLLLALLIAHALATLVAALWFSTRVWGFVSGGLFYIVIAFVFGIQFMKSRQKMRLSSVPSSPAHQVAQGEFLRSDLSGNAVAGSIPPGSGSGLRTASGSGGDNPVSPSDITVPRQRPGNTGLAGSPPLEPLLPVLDEAGVQTGTQYESGCHNGSHLLHPWLRLHVLDGAGKIYLRKRSSQDPLDPGLWDVAMEGHVHAGETLEESLSRLVRERLGISLLALGAPDAPPRLAFGYIHTTMSESMLALVHVCQHAGPFFVPSGFAETARFWPLREVLIRKQEPIFSKTLVKDLEILLGSNPSTSEDPSKPPLNADTADHEENASGRKETTTGSSDNLTFPAPAGGVA